MDVLNSKKRKTPHELRSGGRSVTHGASRGIESQSTPSIDPMAHAVGFRSFAAPRLITYAQQPEVPLISIREAVNRVSKAPSLPC